MLEWGLQQALSPEGKIVYLTATPSEEGLRKNKHAGRNLFRLPARHHRYPLPVPQWLKFTYRPQKPGLNRKMEKQLREAVARGITLIFVPQISWVKPLVQYLELKFSNCGLPEATVLIRTENKNMEDLRQGFLCLCAPLIWRGV